MSIQISVAICTLNRADYLRKALQSLAEQTLSTELYEILVVDNNSTDQTKEVATEEFSYLSNLRYLFEPILGLSQARNTAWQQAKGKYVAYLDDDAIASPQWLEKILEVFDTRHPRPGCVGGKVEPIWEKPRPDWLSDKLLPYLTVIDWADAPLLLKGSKYAAGANMAFPKQVIEEIGGFETRLGRKGKNLLSNEEMYVREQLDALSYETYYHPQASVKHHVAASRLKKQWFIDRSYWQGVSQAVQLNLRKQLCRKEKNRLALSEIKAMAGSPKFFFNLLIPPYNLRRLEIKCYVYARLGYTIALLRY